MAKKRKSDSSRLDEVDRSMYATFCTAANSLSQLYTHAMHQQKLSFQAGERHSMEKLRQWILQQLEVGTRVVGADVLTYLQNELDHGEDSSMSPRVQFQHHHQHSQPANPNLQNHPFGQGMAGSGPRSAHPDQSRNSVFSNALSSQVRQSLQPFQLTQGGYYQNVIIPTNNGVSQNRESISLGSNDSTMDMHSDSPARETY